MGVSRVLTTPADQTAASSASLALPRWLLPAAVVLAFIAYAPALDNYFIADDFNWLYEAERTWQHPLNIFSLVIANFFRPVVHVWFALLRPLAGVDPLWYYIAAVFAHGVCGVVVAWAIARLTRDRLAGTLAGLFFVVHFTHFDAVYWLSAISDIVGTMLTVAAIACAAGAARQHGRLGWGALVLTPLVLMAKESMVMIVPLLVWTLWSFRTGTRLTRQAAWLAPAVLVWVGYLFMQRHFQANSPHVTTGYYALGWHAPRMLLNAVVNFVLPNRYLVPAPGWVVLLLLGLLTAGAVAATRRLRPGQGRTAWFFAGWVVLAFLPCVFFQNYDRIPSRYSYLPSVACAGFLGWVGAAWWRARAPMTRGARLRTLVCVTALAALNVAYIWRIDRVRYEPHSRVSRSVLWRMRHDHHELTPETTVVAFGIGLPHRGLHFIPALEQFLNEPLRGFITVAPGEPAPREVPAPALWYRWDETRERLTPVAPPAEGA